MKKEIFEFSSKNKKKALKIIKQYPQGQERSAVMALLYLAQEQNNNWISIPAMNYIANFLNIPPIYVYEVANFYTMYNKKPVGKYLIQVCRTTPCWLCNSESILTAIKHILQIDVGETTKDLMFTLVEVECLGSCITAPVCQINEKYYENLTEQKIIEIINELRNST